MAKLSLGLQLGYWGAHPNPNFVELAQEAENRELEERNDALRAEVEDLSERLEAVEERARSELGLIREGEEFFQVVPESAAEEQDPDGTG